MPRRLPLLRNVERSTALVVVVVVEVWDDVLLTLTRRTLSKEQNRIGRIE